MRSTQCMDDGVLACGAMWWAWWKWRINWKLSWVNGLIFRFKSMVSFFTKCDVKLRDSSLVILAVEIETIRKTILTEVNNIIGFSWPGCFENLNRASDSRTDSKMNVTYVSKVRFIGWGVIRYLFVSVHMKCKFLYLFSLHVDCILLSISTTSNLLDSIHSYTYLSSSFWTLFMCNVYIHSTVLSVWFWARVLSIIHCIPVPGVVRSSLAIAVVSIHSSPFLFVFYSLSWLNWSVFLLFRQ